jgi:hypothetical protein
MPSSELAAIRGGIRKTILGIWGEWGTWRAKGDQGFTASRRVFVKVQWNSKLITDRYFGTEREGAEVYMSRDESEDAVEPGVATPTLGSELELDSELGRPLVYKEDLRDKSPQRVKMLLDRNRRITTGGRA